MIDDHLTPSPTGQLIDSEGVARPPWAYRSDAELDYYDNEWGRPVITEHGLLERITLEGFQSGLSWATVLRKRRDFRSVFFMFDATRITAMTESDRETALSDARLIRNPQKHRALYVNAQATVELRDDPDYQKLPADAPAYRVLGGAAERLAPGLPVLVWSFVPEVEQRPASLEEIPTTSPEAKALAKALKSHGFSFVGPTTCYALMQAIGMVNDRVDEGEGSAAER